MTGPVRATWQMANIAWQLWTFALSQTIGTKSVFPAL